MYKILSFTDMVWTEPSMRWVSLSRMGLDVCSKSNMRVSKYVSKGLLYTCQSHMFTAVHE